MAIRYTLVETNSTDVPGAAGATYNRGFNVPGGAVSEIIVRIQGTMNADISRGGGALLPFETWWFRLCSAGWVGLHSGFSTENNVFDKIIISNEWAAG